ncbi:MAG: hypothetical protein H0U23_06210 [Blastocatellia bacterium]|nr:hypothetical protein [Blastocatellia bacterium]
MLIGEVLLGDAWPFVQSDMSVVHEWADDRLVVIVGPVVVKVKVLNTDAQVKSDPLIQIRCRVLEDETCCEVMHLEVGVMFAV